jgi:sporulation integral membrane protein YtvI
MERKNFLYLVLCGAAAVFIFCFCFKYVLSVALPFLIAFFIASSVQGAAGRFSSRTGAGKRVVSLLFGLLFFAAVVFFAFLSVSKLWGELTALAKSALEAREDIMGLTGKLLRRAESFILRFFPSAEGGAEILRAKTELFAEEALRSIVSAVSTKLPAFMGKIFSEVPKILFSIGVTFISCIYFCLDYDMIKTRALKLISRGGSPILTKIPHTSFITIVKYLRAVFIIFIITATALALGFLIIGVEYAWLFAAVAAFIDALPVFGSGALLLPYAAFQLISGNPARGAGVCLLWLAVTLIRQVAEPKIMGKSLGVHPLLNLASVYAGASFFGVTGVIFMPITVVILKNLLLPEERS